MLEDLSILIKSALCVGVLSALNVYVGGRSVRKGLCPAVVMSCEPQGLVDSGAISWNRTEAQGAAPE